MIEKIDPRWIVEMMFICTCIMIPLLYFILPALWFDLSLIISSVMGIRNCWHHEELKKLREEISVNCDRIGLRMFKIRFITGMTITQALENYIGPSMLFSALLYIATINAVDTSTISDNLDFSIWRLAYDWGTSMLG